jgi:hypothetical protein
MKHLALTRCSVHGRIARGGHGLPKVSPRPPMPDLSTPSGRATPETALQLFQGWPARRTGGLPSFSTLLAVRLCSCLKSFVIMSEVYLEKVDIKT